MEVTGSSIRYRASVTRNSKGYSVGWTVERTFSAEEIGRFNPNVREEMVIEAVQMFGKKLEAAYPATLESSKPEKVAANGAS